MRIFSERVVIRSTQCHRLTLCFCHILLYKDSEASYEAHQRHLVTKSSNKLLHRSDSVLNWDQLSESPGFITIIENCWEESLAGEIQMFFFCFCFFLTKFRRFICVKWSEKKIFWGEFWGVAFFHVWNQVENNLGRFFFSNISRRKIFSCEKNLNFFSKSESFYNVFISWKIHKHSFFYFQNNFPLSFLQKIYKKCL